MAERTLYQSAPVMRLYIAEHPFHYEMENLCRIFFHIIGLKPSPAERMGTGRIFWTTAHWVLTRVCKRS